jgi:hypothetical protein
MHNIPEKTFLNSRELAGVVDEILEALSRLPTSIPHDFKYRLETAINKHHYRLHDECGAELAVLLVSALDLVGLARSASFFSAPTNDQNKQSVVVEEIVTAMVTFVNQQTWRGDESDDELDKLASAQFYAQMTTRQNLRSFMHFMNTGEALESAKHLTLAIISVVKLARMPLTTRFFEERYQVIHAQLNAELHPQQVA